MYCPGCGTQNSVEDARYCRKCGDDLRLVSKAMAGQISFPMFVATKIDQFLESTPARTQNSAWNLTLGAALLAMSIWSFVGGSIFFGTFCLSTALLSLLMGFRELWISRRKRAGDSGLNQEPSEGNLSILSAGAGPLALPSKPATNRIPAAAEAGQSSVTESTTEFLEEGNGQAMPRS